MPHAHSALIRKNPPLEVLKHELMVKVIGQEVFAKRSPLNRKPTVERFFSAEKSEPKTTKKHDKKNTDSKPR